ncbi:hypothetical protein Q6247_25950, partial [Klebsiella pneumoniae]
IGRVSICTRWRWRGVVRSLHAFTVRAPAGGGIGAGPAGIARAAVELEAFGFFCRCFAAVSVVARACEAAARCFARWAPRRLCL